MLTLFANVLTLRCDVLAIIGLVLTLVANNVGDRGRARDPWAV